jgi:hypothetical protein
MPRSAMEAAAGTLRRAIRKLAIEAGIPVKSHVDGSLDFYCTVVEVEEFMQSNRTVASLNAKGWHSDSFSTLRVLGQNDSFCTVAVTGTVEQGRVGQHFYRGNGEYALSGSKHAAWQAGGLTLLEAAEAAEAAGDTEAAEALLEQAAEAEGTQSEAASVEQAAEAEGTQSEAASVDLEAVARFLSRVKASWTAGRVRTEAQSLTGQDYSACSKVQVLTLLQALVAT